MRVVFDYQIFAEQEFGGISRYFCSLAAAMSETSGVDIKVVAPIYINAYLRESRHGVVYGKYLSRLPKTAQMIKYLSGALFGPVASIIKPEIVHETYYAPQATYRGSAARVLTVYDMIHEKFPGSFSKNDPVALFKAKAVHRADHIFCISENTRRDLIEIHNIPEWRISVTYLGYESLQPSVLSSESLVGAAPYLLYVGGRSGYKNFEGLLRAYAGSSWMRNNFRIVSFGGGGFNDAERHVMSALGLQRQQVIHVGGDDERLAALYRGAAALVYPSMYEGFGIPPLEAMSLACPVICSNTSSIPEVVGEAGEYFEPSEPESIRYALEKVLQSESRRSQLIDLGHDRCKMFSWTRCAQETADIYRRLAP